MPDQYFGEGFGAGFLLRPAEAIAPAINRTRRRRRSKPTDYQMTLK